MAPGTDTIPAINTEAIRQNKFWYIAFVKSCMEKKAASALSSLGFECYLPIRREVHKWSDRNKTVDRVLITGIIFIRTTPEARLEPLKMTPYVYGYMSACGQHKPAIVRDEEMDTFRAMVDGSGREVSISNVGLAPGDFVKVLSGPLAGRVCELVSINGRNCLAVRIPMLGAATIELSADIVEKAARPE